MLVRSESFVSEKGKRAVNEDNLQFQSGKFYLVCDGLGGNGNGQIASKLVAETVKESLLNLKSISEAVEEAEIVLSSYKKKNPSTEENMLNLLLNTQYEGESISYELLSAECLTFLLAGHETVIFII